MPTEELMGGMVVWFAPDVTKLVQMFEDQQLALGRLQERVSAAGRAHPMGAQTMGAETLSRRRVEDDDEIQKTRLLLFAQHGTLKSPP